MQPAWRTASIAGPMVIDGRACSVRILLGGPGGFTTWRDMVGQDDFYDNGNNKRNRPTDEQLEASRKILEAIACGGARVCNVRHHLRLITGSPVFKSKAALPDSAIRDARRRSSEVLKGRVRYGLRVLLDIQPGTSPPLGEELGRWRQRVAAANRTLADRANRLTV